MSGLTPNQIVNPKGNEITHPSNQINALYSKPSFGMDNMQILNQPPENVPQIYRGHRKKWGRTYINILHDPRVVRGNTYAAFVIPSSLQMEFLKLREEEDKKKKLLQPIKVPRVALLGRNRKEETSVKDEEEKRPESPILKPIENKEEVTDSPYFYEDKPAVPLYVPLPPGKEEYTQIVDGELFDFDLEVKPILEVLVGRSVLQAKYELIEEEERDQYLKHKREYERKREFELNNLQRTEARYLRREEEKQRRFKQKEQRKLNDIIMQKKLMAKVFSNSYFKGLKSNSFRRLQELGFLTIRPTYPLNFYLKNNYYPITEKINKLAEFTEEKLMRQVRREVEDEITAAHKESVEKENNRIAEILAKKEADRIAAEEAEKERRAAQLERREQRRIKRITDSIMTNIVATNSTRKDVMNLPLSDIDELSIKGDCIHCFGQLGETLFVISEVVSDILPLEFSSSLDIKDFMSNFVQEFLLNGLPGINNDTLNLELKYLESPKYDFENIPEDKKEDFKNFLKDERRYISKSLHMLIDMGVVKKESVNSFNEAVADIYFKQNIEPEKVEGDPENQEPEYLEKIRIENENNEKKAADENAKYEKMKKRIKIVFIKPEVFKKKRNNIGGFITVDPNILEKEKVTEIEEVPIKKEEEEKPENPIEEGEKIENEEGKEEQKEANPEEEKPKEEKPKEEVKPEEEKPKEEQKQEEQKPEGEKPNEEQKPEGDNPVPQEGQEQQPPQPQSKIILFSYFYS